MNNKFLRVGKKKIGDFVNVIRGYAFKVLIIVYKIKIVRVIKFQTQIVFRL